MNGVLLEERALRRGSLVLVNRAHPVSGRETPELVPFAAGGRDVQLDPRAAAMLNKLLRESGCGREVVAVSGYRPQSEQQRIYDDSLRDNGAEFTRQYVAPPGCSEHQTGLAVDLAARAETVDFLRPDFPDTGACARFREAAPRYGFVLRYGRDKERVTGIAHEPWHFRYVGFPHAKIMEAQNLCLEEYTDFLRAADRAVQYVFGPYRIEVSFLPAAACGRVPELPPDAAGYQLSGNNVDGFVLTVWRWGYGAA